MLFYSYYKIRNRLNLQNENIWVKLIFILFTNGGGRVI